MDYKEFLNQWNDASTKILVQTSGSTGTPKKIWVDKERMRQSARMTCEYLQLKPHDKALLCLPVKYIAGKMMVVRADVGQLDLIITEPNGHPLANISSSIDFAAMTPMQVYKSLQNPIEENRLRKIKKLLIGGGPIDKTLASFLSDFSNEVYASYGMTETLSHIALRRVNGPKSSEYFSLLKNITISLSPQNTLIIKAPLLCASTLQTNDIVELLDNNTFKILGRIDNIINSGGIKIQIEEIEKDLSYPKHPNFAITSIPHPIFGEALVLLAEKEVTLFPIDKLPPYAKPKYISIVNEIPLTPNGKIDRKACKDLASKTIKF